VLIANGILNVTHPILQFNVLHSRRPPGSNAKQGSTSNLPKVRSSNYHNTTKIGRLGSYFSSALFSLLLMSPHLGMDEFTIFF